MGISCVGVGTVFQLTRRILCLIALLITLVSIALPWYYIEYKYEINQDGSTGEYDSNAYLQVWYKYEQVSCDFSNEQSCNGQPGSLITSEGLSLWNFDDHYALKTLYIVCWSFVVANLILLIYLIIRSNSPRLITYIAFMLTLLSCVFFVLLSPELFAPCSFDGINLTQNGPCYSFSSDVQLTDTSSIHWGAYIGWWATVLVTCIHAVCLFITIIVKD